MREDPHPAQVTAFDLEEGDEIIVNDRVRPLTVVDSEPRDSNFSHRDRGEEKTLILKGNGTDYHMIITEKDHIGPMLYVDIENYNGGERVEEIDVQ